MMNSFLKRLYFSIVYLTVNILVSCSPPSADLGKSPISKPPGSAPPEMGAVRGGGGDIASDRVDQISISKPPVFSTSDMGGVHGGGGDVASERVEQIVKSLGISSDEKNAKIKETLIKIVDSMNEFLPHTKAGLQFALLIKKGLKEDIMEAKYLLKQFCANEEGIEKSASTNKVDISEMPTASHPDVCINVRKLALENATTKEIVGLLMHEHARHFGLEDTNNVGIHPLALAVTSWYPSMELLSQFKRFGASLWLKGPPDGKDYVDGLKESISFENLAVMSNNPESVHIQVKVTNGVCAFRFQSLQAVPGSIELGESKKDEIKVWKLAEIPLEHPTFNIYTSEKCGVALQFVMEDKILFSREFELSNANLIGFRIGLHSFPKSDITPSPEVP